MIFLYLIWW